MKVNLFCAIVLCSFVIACAPSPDDGLSTTKQMFENAVRRDAKGAEVDYVANVGGCTAFFVENNQGKTLMMTARHCTQNDPAAWCANVQIVRQDGEVGKCTGVLATDVHNDIFLYTASFKTPPKKALRLAYNPPAVDTRLIMVGFPADPDTQNHDGRNGALTVTENCWVLGSGYKSPYLTSPAYKEHPFDNASALHNCSTYGGNSGGPMLIEGSNIAVGLPFTYIPNYFENMPKELKYSANLAEMRGFARPYGQVLKEHGVTVVMNPSDPEDEGAELKDNPTADVMSGKDSGGGSQDPSEVFFACDIAQSGQTPATYFGVYWRKNAQAAGGETFFTLDNKTYSPVKHLQGVNGLLRFGIPKYDTDFFMASSVTAQNTVDAWLQQAPKSDQYFAYRCSYSSR